MTKVLLFDIETTHLKADFGTVLCVGYKWLDSPNVYVDSITDWKGWKRNVTDDSSLIECVSKVLAQADMWVTYYGKMFDVPYLQAKLLEYGGQALPNIPHVDLYFTARQHLPITSRRLGNVGKYLKCEVQKSPVDGRIWKKAMVGDEASIAYVVKHCDHDVRLLEEVYLKLRGLVRTHPRVSTLEACRYCGSDRLQRRGLYITVTQANKQRVQCQGCGGWDTRKLEAA